MQYSNSSFSLIDVHNYGTKNKKTGKWSGMMGNLTEGLVDLAVAPFLINSQRSEVVQYVTAMFPLNAKFIFRRPTLSKTNNIFLLPFDEFVWAFTILLIGVVVVLMTCVVFVELKWCMPNGNLKVHILVINIHTMIALYINQYHIIFKGSKT